MNYVFLLLALLCAFLSGWLAPTRPPAELLAALGLSDRAVSGVDQGAAALPRGVTSHADAAPFLNDFVQLYRHGEMRFVPRSRAANTASLLAAAREAYADESIGVLRTATGEPLEALDARFWQANERSPKPFIVCLAENERWVWPALRVGESVEVELKPDQRANTSRIVRVHTLSSRPRALLVPKFLSDAECEELTRIAKAEHMFKSTVGGGDGKDDGEERDVRTSEQTWIWPGGKSDSIIAQRVRQRTLDLVKLPADVAEATQLVHYGLTQHYYGHHDYAHKWESVDNPYVQAGGNRLVTVIYYLNDVEEGGQTVFPFANSTTRPVLDENGNEKIWVYDEKTNRNIYYGYEGCDGTGLRVEPIRGSALIFYNVLEEHTFDAVPDSYSFHAGCDVTKGDKFMANVWIRNRRIDGKLFNAQS